MADGGVGFFSAAPLIETERLRLRAHRPDDLAACTALWADPEITRRIVGRPATRDEVWTKILRYAGLWALLGFGYWVVEEKATGAFAGELGFANFMREITPPLDAPEIGWVLAAHARGKGYAREAAKAALAWSDASLSCEKTLCIIDPENLKSRRIAEKCGYRKVRDTEYEGKATILYARTKGAPHPA